MWDLKRETLGFDPIKIVINANADLIHTYECVSVYVCVCVGPSDSNVGTHGRSGGGVEGAG